MSEKTDDIMERLRERMKIKYMGNCKCGHCQLVNENDLAEAIAEIRSLRPSPDRAAIVEECAKTAHEAAGQFMSNSDRYVMQGPSGLVRAMLGAIRSLSSPAKGGGGVVGE